jgi:hypothetical protein
MARKLFAVEDMFFIRGRGLVLVPGINPQRDERFRANNHAEREIRPAVVMRKMSYGNASARGATTRAILMSIHRTLKARGLDPSAETRKALKNLLQTGTLPNNHPSTN